MNYYVPRGGLPGQAELASDRTRFTTSYALICKDTMRDIVTSRLPFWEGTRLWVLARPLSGFAETFSQYIVEVAPGGGSDRPDTDPGAESALFVVHGTVAVTIEGVAHELSPGGYAFIPPGSTWTLHNRSGQLASLHWIRKAYQRVEGLDVPDPVIANEREIEPVAMPDTDGAWATTLFVDPADLRHDMHVTIVTLQPGASIPFAETHVMEHGLYVLQGKAVYLLNQDWLEVQAGDFMWLRAFCPQACTAAGPEPFRYLLYKDVNRHAPLPRSNSARQN
jgi:(S)-ureidoglycine aminohydrolase